VHYETERQTLDGGDERFKVKNKSQSAGKSVRGRGSDHGRRSRRVDGGIPDCTTFIAKHRSVIDPHYKVT